MNPVQDTLRVALSGVINTGSYMLKKGHRWKVAALVVGIFIPILSGYFGIKTAFAIGNLAVIGTFAYILTSISGEESERPDMLDRRGE